MNDQTAKTALITGVGCGVRKGSIIDGLYREICVLPIYEGACEARKVVIARQQLEGM